MCARVCLAEYKEEIVTEYLLAQGLSATVVQMQGALLYCSHFMLLFSQGEILLFSPYSHTVTCYFANFI